MADFFWFSDAQWARIAPLLPANGRGKRRVDDRRVVSGIVHALKCGGRWADWPEADCLLVVTCITSPPSFVIRFE